MQDLSLAKLLGGLLREFEHAASIADSGDDHGASEKSSRLRGAHRMHPLLGELLASGNTGE